MEFKLPDVGEGITEGELIQWRVKEGDEINEDQILLELETDKAVVEIPSPRSGVIQKLFHKDGDIVKVGEVLVVIGDCLKHDIVDNKKRDDAGTVVGVLEEASDMTDNQLPKEILVTPGVRKFAEEFRVDISKINGTGPQGRITEEDIKLASLEKKSGVRRDRDNYGAIIRVPIRGRRKTIAQNMIKSIQSAAHVTHMDEVDMTELALLKFKEAKLFEKKGKKLTYLPFIIKAVVIGLKEYSFLNSTINEETGEIILKKYYNIGIGVDTKDGLIVPAIKDADKKSIIQLAEEIEDLGERGRNRKLDIKELKGGTFSISNIGSIGGIFATPIVYYPEAAILGTGRIKEKPVVKDGSIQIRKILPLSLSFDHRIMDGGVVARFVKTVINHLEDPGLLLLELR